MKKLAIFAAVMVVGAGAAFTTTLSVPFFLDNSSNAKATSGTGFAGLIGLRNDDTVDQVITVIYSTATDSGVNANGQTVTFNLLAGQSIDFSPVTVDTTLENEGSIVPEMTLEFTAGGGPSIAGSATIVAPGAVSGRYRQISYALGSEMGYTLLPQ